MRLWPGGSLRFWGIVGLRVRARGVRPNDWARVENICREVERDLGGRCVGKLKPRETAT
jgi:hypothetical protein